MLHHDALAQLHNSDAAGVLAAGRKRKQKLLRNRQREKKNAANRSSGPLAMARSKVQRPTAGGQVAILRRKRFVWLVSKRP